MTYVWIAPGTFRMGCSAADDECLEDEKPAYEVTITHGFWIGQTAVTQEAYQHVIGVNRRRFKGSKLPVETISWNEARKYCEAVGMPTEAEWEYAARAGGANRYSEPSAIAWFRENSGEKTHEVGRKQPNAWMLYDMLGNVWEWVADFYANSYSREAEIDPNGARWLLVLRSEGRAGFGARQGGVDVSR